MLGAEYSSHKRLWSQPLSKELDSGADGGFAERIVEGCQGQLVASRSVEIDRIVRRKLECTRNAKNMAKGDERSFGLNRFREELFDLFEEKFRIVRIENLSPLGHGESVGHFEVPEGRDKRASSRDQRLADARSVRRYGIIEKPTERN
jgi:hypothetical protein